MPKIYKYIGKGKLTSSNPHFIQFGSTQRGKKYAHRTVLGEIIKRETEEAGYPEKKVYIQITANRELSQDDIIKELKKGAVISKRKMKKVS